MAAEYPSEERQKKMARDMMKYRSTNSTIGQGPLSAMTAAQKAAAPMRQIKDKTVVNKNTTAMPTVLPKSMAIRRSPEELIARDRANETSSAMQGVNYNETPAAPLTKQERDQKALAAQRAMLATKRGGPSPAQLATDANLEKYRQERMGEQPNTFAAFLKSLGLGK